MPLFKMTQVTKAYQKKSVLRGINISIESGQIVGLLGPNGAGKTTAFYTAMGLVSPDAGHLEFLGEPIEHLSISQRALRGMGYLAQEPSIFKDLSVEDNIMVALELIEPEKSSRLERLSVLLVELGLEKIAHRKARLLSGGERRRLEIARCLATDPKLLFLDEPFANVDPITIEEMKRLIQHLKARGISVLITDHNAREIFSVADYAYLMQDGEITFEGPPLSWLKNAAVKKAYLGANFDAALAL